MSQSSMSGRTGSEGKKDPDMESKNNSDDEKKTENIPEIPTTLSPEDIIIDEDVYSDDKLREKIDHILKLPGNVCAECGDKAEWGSTNLKTLMCIKCSGTHRKMGTHISRVKSLYLDNWKKEELIALRDGGTKMSNSTWEVHLLPGCKPNKDDSVPFKEAFIRAKYERKQFVAESGEKKPPVGPFGFPRKEGMLTKEGKVVKSWKTRFFVLSGSMLFYYKKPKDKTPAGVIPFAQTTHFRCLEETIDHHSFLFTVATKDREFKISAENAENMFEWVSALKFAHQLLIPSGSELESRTASADDFSAKDLAPKLVKELKDLHKVHGALKKDSYHGSTIVDWVVLNCPGVTREVAKEIGKRLIAEIPNLKIVPPANSFQDDESLYLIK